MNSNTVSSNKSVKSNTKTSASIIEFNHNNNNNKTATKSKQKVKPFNLEKFLVTNHANNLIYVIDIPKQDIWHLNISRSNIRDKSGMFFLVDHEEQIIYIALTNNLGLYTRQLYYNLKKPQVKTVYFVENENPSMYVHAVTAYRAKFMPKLNSTNNTRFTFNPVNAQLNDKSKSPTTQKLNSVQWIKENPNSTYTEFVALFGQYEVRKLCKIYNIENTSYVKLLLKVLIK